MVTEYGPSRVPDNPGRQHWPERHPTLGRRRARSAVPIAQQSGGAGNFYVLVLRTTGGGWSRPIADVGRMSLMRALGSKRMAAAVKRQDRGYSFPVPKVPDADWVSQFEAARELRIGHFRVGALVVSGQLDAVHNSRRQAGVSRASVEKQRSRRVGIGLLRRTLVFATDSFRLFINGI